MDEHSRFQASHDHSNCNAELALRLIQLRLRETHRVMQCMVHSEVPPRLHAWGSRVQAQA